MSRINLLPWREWERERRNRVFLTGICTSGACALVVALLAGGYIDHLKARQEARAEVGHARLRALDERIEHVRDVRRQSARLEARVAVLRGLHEERSTVARVLHELARTAPSGTHYERLAYAGGLVTASGTAESAARISALMRGLEASERFGMATLRSIHEDQDNAEYGGRAVHFDLAFALRPSPQQAAEG